MLDIGSTELLLILVLGLIILGPEQIKSIAKLFGKMKSKLNKMTQEVQTTIKDNEDLKEIEDALKGVGETVEDAKESMKGATADIDAELHKANKGAKDMRNELNDMYREAK